MPITIATTLTYTAVKHHIPLPKTRSYDRYEHHPCIISTPKVPDLAQISENSLKFERVFLYQHPQNRRTPLPTHQIHKFKATILDHTQP